MQVLLGRLDERRQRRDRRARAERNELRRQRGTRETAHRNAARDCDDGVEQKCNDDAHERVGHDVEADRAGQRCAGMNGERKDEREDADRRSENDPADEDEHRVAQSAKEARQRLTRRLGRARDREREEQREEDQRHHRPARGGGDRIRREERDKPRRERLRLSVRSDFLRRFDRAGWKLQRPVRGQERENRQRDRNDDDGDSNEKQQKSNERSPAESADRLDVRHRCDAGDQQRDDERDDRHANRVHPERADRRDRVGGADQCGVMRCRDEDAEDDRGDESEEDARALFHHIIKSPPLMSNDAPVM